MEEQEKETPKAPEASPASSSGEDEKLMALLAYFGGLVLIPLLVKKDSEYVRFHVQQGLTLLVAEAVWVIAGRILAFIPILGWLIVVVGWLILLILSFIGIANALSGKKAPLPILGGLAKNFNI